MTDDERLLALLRTAYNDDIEMGHLKMDQELSRELARLGYVKAMKFYEEQDKWYA